MKLWKTEINELRKNGHIIDGIILYGRGVGIESGRPCFICGKECFPNFAAFVESKADGENIVKWIGQGARLDFRDYEPDWIQVKVYSCKEHRPLLSALHDYIDNDLIIESQLKEFLDYIRKEYQTITFDPSKPKKCCTSNSEYDVQYLENTSKRTWSCNLLCYKCGKSVFIDNGISKEDVLTKVIELWNNKD